MFNALGSLDVLDGARVLDLFAGSGAMGIEALSRGAAHATFVEPDRRARAAVEANLASTGLADRATVVGLTAAAWLEARGGAAGIDLVFADPPYAFDGWSALLAATPAALVVIESDREVVPPPPWRVLRSRRYGTTFVVFTEREVPSAAETM